MAEAPAPLEIARRLRDRIEDFRPTNAAVKQAMCRVQERRRKRREPPERKGHEYVVEALFRPFITRLARRMLGIKNRHEIPCRVYSSHFHTIDDTEEVWRQRFACFLWTHPSADTFDGGGHRRRADLFIATGINRIVSIEFKYVAPDSRPPVRACARQVRQYLTRHKACVLVICYAGIPAPCRMENDRDEIERSIRSKRGFVVAVPGPEVQFT